MGTGPKHVLPFERRGAKRFPRPLRVELWIRDHARGEHKSVRIKDISLRGLYFFSDLRKAPGSRLSFSVKFRRELTGQEVVLLRGTAAVVRCEDAVGSDAEPFGIAAEIKKTTYEYGDSAAPFELLDR
jgi:hypothetical protein